MEQNTIKPNNHKENLSSSVLFTFTPKMEYMLDMIGNGIVPRYSYERLPGSKKHYIVPMKCFCDIPLGKVKNHMQRYGYYGIGLKKSFLKDHGASPVIYIHKNSERFFGLRKMKGLSLDKSPFLPLLKRYFGDDYFFGKNPDDIQHKRIRFYDEREWRFIPKNVIPEIDNNLMTIKEGLKFVREKNELTTFKATTPIKPSITDIEYIIIHKKKEISEVIEKLRILYGETKDWEVVLTKIVVAEQVLKDY
jgi:hypothetical protein